MSTTPDQQQIIAKGIVLAVNCVPDDVDANIRSFWEALGHELATAGFTLIVASTARLVSSSLNIIPIPFNLTDYALHYADRASSCQHDSVLLDSVTAWYGCSSDVAATSLDVAREYFGELLDALTPCSVIGWQRTNPVTRMLLSQAENRSLPVWAAERGWINDTLMFDLGYGNFLSEIQRSVAVDRQMQRFCLDEQRFNDLVKRSRAREKTGRYASEGFLDRNALREKLCIPEEATVVAFFNHGEPHLYTSDRDALAALHASGPSHLQRQIDEVAAYCAAHGHYLLVQEHPFNLQFNRMLSLPDLDNVIRVEENIHSLLEGADRFLFTISTIQFDALFAGKPFGLLSRGILHRTGGAYAHEDYSSTSAFMSDLVAAGQWPARYKELSRVAQFLFDDFLHDITPEHCKKSAAAFAQHLSRFGRPVTELFSQRIDRFLSKWAVS